MKTFSVLDAKTHLSRLIARASSGEDIVIARGGKPVARLVPIRTAPARRRFGAMKGKARVTPAFFEPLPEAEAEAWET